MKKFILCIIAFTMLSFAHAQETNDTLRPPPRISSDQATYSAGDSTVVLTGHVNYKSDAVSIQDAEKIILDRRSQRIRVYRYKNYTVTDSIRVRGQARRKNLFYKIGSGEIRLE